jgi:hypothetical protein
MMVMRIAITPSLNASSRPFVIEHFYVDAQPQWAPRQPASVELTCEIADARCGSVQLATARRTVSLR